VIHVDLVSIDEWVGVENGAAQVDQQPWRSGMPRVNGD
ncbi:uncharacterized protein METZ01_LOCUS164289, partial [marine metagenome]